MEDVSPSSERKSARFKDAFLEAGKYWATAAGLLLVLYVALPYIDMWLQTARQNPFVLAISVYAAAAALVQWRLKEQRAGTLMPILAIPIFIAGYLEWQEPEGYCRTQLEQYKQLEHEQFRLYQEWGACLQRGRCRSIDYAAQQLHQLQQRMDQLGCIEVHAYKRSQGRVTEE